MIALRPADRGSSFPFVSSPSSTASVSGRWAFPEARAQPVRHCTRFAGNSHYQVVCTSPAGYYRSSTVISRKTARHEVLRLRVGAQPSTGAHLPRRKGRDAARPCRSICARASNCGRSSPSSIPGGPFRCSSWTTARRSARRRPAAAIWRRSIPSRRCWAAMRRRRR